MSKFSEFNVNGGNERGLSGPVQLIGYWHLINLAFTLYSIGQALNMKGSSRQNMMVADYLNEIIIVFSVIAVLTVFLLISFYKKDGKYFLFEGISFVLKLGFLGYLMVVIDEYHIFSSDYIGVLSKAVIASTIIGLYLYKTKEARDVFI